MLFWNQSMCNTQTQASFILIIFTLILLPYKTLGAHRTVHISLVCAEEHQGHLQAKGGALEVGTQICGDHEEPQV